MILMIMDKIALVLVVLGAVNMGSIGIFNYDIISGMFGSHMAVASRVLYTVVGLAGLWSISLLFRERDRIGEDI